MPKEAAVYVKSPGYRNTAVCAGPQLSTPNRNVAAKVEAEKAKISSPQGTLGPRDAQLIGSQFICPEGLLMPTALSQQKVDLWHPPRCSIRWFLMAGRTTQEQTVDP